MFAAPRDMEPGMYFRTYNDGPVLRWRGVEGVVARFPERGRHWVRVLVDGGVPFVVDASVRFQVVDFSGGGN